MESVPRRGPASPGLDTETFQETVVASLEHEFEPKLNGSWNAHGAIPLPKARAGHIILECQIPKAVRGTVEDVPVPHVEELGPELHADTFGNLCSLVDGEVLIVVAKAPEVRHTRSLSVIEIEAIGGLERICVEQRSSTRVIVSLALSKRVRPRENGRDACYMELVRHRARTTRPEHEWNTRLHA
jgi:hypothetical protein